jgi:hypothetical protein
MKDDKNFIGNLKENTHRAYIKIIKNKAEKELKKAIKEKEERVNRRLTREEVKSLRKRVLKRVERRQQINIRMTGLIVVLTGITMGTIFGGEPKTLEPAKTTKQVETTVDNEETSIEEEKTTEEETTFKDSIKVTDSGNSIKNTQINSEVEIMHCLLKYNEKYGTDLTPDDLSYMISEPVSLGVREDGSYVYDCTRNTEVASYIIDGHDVGIGQIYIIINNKENKIIASVGSVGNKAVDIDTKMVIKGKNKEVVGESDKKINLLEGLTDDEKEDLRFVLCDLYHKQNEKESESEIGLE